MRKKKEDNIKIERERKKIKKIPFLILIAVAVFTGVMIGKWFISNTKPTDIYNFDVMALYDNTALIKAQAVGKTPIEIGATKSFIVALDNTENYNLVRIDGYGNVNAMGINQSIKTQMVKNGNKLMLENVSISMFVKAADRFYLEDDGNISHVKGSVSNGYVNWDGSSDTMTQTEYYEKMGTKITDFLPYIVSSKTVVSETKVSKVGENYTFSLTLDKVKGVAKYVKSMKESGGLSDYPVFSENINLVVVMDSNFRLIEVTSNERYTAKMGPISAPSIGTLTKKFSYDENFQIPDLSQSTKL